MSAQRGKYAAPVHKPRGPQVPIGPIKDWCHQQVDAATHADVAVRLGVNPRILNRIMRGMYCGSRNGHKGQFPAATISRSYVEDMLTHAGVDFYDLYPELEHERDIELEADGLCRRCGEMVTPIRGACPWCDYVVREDIVLQWSSAA